ncbi:MAG: septum site-determining protein MinC [Syntrophobacteraceae bacterium]
MKFEKTIPLQIKAKRGGFILLPDPDASFQSMLDYIQRRLEESRDFFHQSKMTLDLRAKPLMTDEVSMLYALLTQRAEVKLVEVKLADDLSFLIDGSFRQAPIVRESRIASREQSDPEGAHVIIRSTCRSGTRIESPADCVILGDVNPGAEIMAVGNIIVFGNLRGIAHAGASGDRSAKIWALSIEPSQIRIANLVALSARSDKAVSKRYEIAEVHGDLIQVVTV